MEKDQEEVGENNVLARIILTEKLQELGGKAFARWLAEVLGGETKKTADAADFMSGMLEGDFDLENKEYLERYLKPMREIVKALNILKEQ